MQMQEKIRYNSEIQRGRSNWPTPPTRPFHISTLRNAASTTDVPDLGGNGVDESQSGYRRFDESQEKESEPARVPLAVYHLSAPLYPPLAPTSTSPVSDCTVPCRVMVHTEYAY